MRRSATIVRLVLILASAAPLAADEPLAAPPASAEAAPDAALTPGQIVDPVSCRQFPGQSYALYLPSSYSPAKSWPILYAFDARQRGRLVAELFREAAEELGVIIASSNNSRSDEAVDPNPAAMRALWEDTHERFAIDPQRVYATGFSGGARAAVMLATVRSGEVAGVIGVGAGFPEGWTPSRTTPFAFYGLSAEADFNYTELLALDRAFVELGLPHAFDSFPGTHDWPPAERCGDALGWLGTLAIRRGHAPPDNLHLDRRQRAGRQRVTELADAGDLTGAARRAESLISELRDLRDVEADAAALERLRSSASFRAEAEHERAAVEEFERFVQSASAELSTALRLPPEGWQLSLVRGRLGVPKLEKLAAASPSAAARRGARQSLEALFVQTAFYLPRTLVAAGNHVAAARCYEIAASIHPEQPGLWYRLAQERALSKERRGALKALREAVDHGFADAARLSNDEAFAAIRDDKAFRELLARLGAPHGAASGSTP